MREITKKVFTLVIIYANPRVLLGMKKKGFGAGRWNGFGGKVEEGETEEAARRELKEEASIEAGELEKIGINEFEWKGGSEFLEVHIFKARDFRGEPRESDEMSPRWFSADGIPFERMWADDRYWFPLFLQDKKFRGSFLFDDSDRILKMKVEEVKEHRD